MYFNSIPPEFELNECILIPSPPDPSKQICDFSKYPPYFVLYMFFIFFCGSGIYTIAFIFFRLDYYIKKCGTYDPYIFFHFFQ